MGKKKAGGVRIKQVGPNKAAKAAMSLGNPMEEFMHGIPPEEMVHLPPPPDRNYQIFWPIHETFTMDHKDFMVIYPSYLDSSKTFKQGRRIGKEHAVDTPTVSDISQALQGLGLKHVLQPHKGYSRDPYTLWDNPGRVKVEPSLPKITILEDGDDEDAATGNAKRRLLLEIASRIPSLPSRIQRLEEQAAARKAAEEEAAQKHKQRQQQQQQQGQKQQQTQSSSKKKGKKKR